MKSATFALLVGLIVCPAEAFAVQPSGPVKKSN